MGEIKHTPWEVGQHPAISDGWIVRPVLFGSNVRVLPEWEGGHVLIRDEKAAHLIAAAPEMKEALEEVVRWDAYPNSSCRDRIKAALAKANGEAPQ